MKFELDRLNQRIPNEELLADMQRAAKELGQDFVTMLQQDKFGKFYSSTIRRRFGSWLVAHQKAGLKKVRLQENRRIPEEELFKNIEKVWRDR